MVDYSFDQANYVPGEIRVIGPVDWVETPSSLVLKSGRGLITDMQVGSLILPDYDVIG